MEGSTEMAVFMGGHEIRDICLVDCFVAAVCRLQVWVEMGQEGETLSVAEYTRLQRDLRHTMLLCTFQARPPTIIWELLDLPVSKGLMPPRAPIVSWSAILATSRSFVRISLSPHRWNIC